MAWKGERGKKKPGRGKQRWKRGKSTMYGDRGAEKPCPMTGAVARVRQKKKEAYR